MYGLLIIAISLIIFIVCISLAIAVKYLCHDVPSKEYSGKNYEGPDLQYVHAYEGNIILQNNPNVPCGGAMVHLCSQDH